MAEWSKAHVWNTCDPQGSQSSNLCLTDFAPLNLIIMQKPQQYEAILHSHNYSPNHQVDFVRIKINDPQFVFEEGQFVMIRVEINGVLVKRSYSIATSFSQFQEDQTLGFIIKLVPDGMFTTWLWNTAQIGEKMTIV